MSRYSPSQIEDMIKTILNEDCLIDKHLITNDARLTEDLGLDSMSAVNLLATLEDKLGIVIDEDDVEELPDTVSSLCHYVADQLAKNSSSVEGRP